MKIDPIERCEAIKEMSRQKSGDNPDTLDNRALLNKIKQLEIENYILKKRLGINETSSERT
jgi:HEPN domain-containing protein